MHKRFNQTIRLAVYDCLPACFWSQLANEFCKNDTDKNRNERKYTQNKKKQRERDLNIGNILLSHLRVTNAGIYNQINNNCIEYAIAVHTSYTFYVDIQLFTYVLYNFARILLTKFGSSSVVLLWPL